MRTHQPSSASPRIDKPKVKRVVPLNSEAWRKLRAAALSRDPLCKHCWAEGVVIRATEVDHIDNDPNNNLLSNLQGLCASHHARKTRQDYGASVKYGCDAYGMPMDPAHPWNTGERSPATGRAEPSAPLHARDRSSNA